MGLEFKVLVSPTASQPSLLSLLETFPTVIGHHLLWMGLAICTVLRSQGTESWIGTVQGWDLCWAARGEWPLARSGLGGQRS